VLAATVLWPTERRTSPSGGHPAAEAQLAQVIPVLQFDNTPLGDVILALREQTGANLVVDWPTLEAVGFDPHMPVELHLRDVTLEETLAALVAYCSSAGELDYTASGDAIILSTGGALAGHVYARIYDASDIHADWLKIAGETFCHPPEADETGQGSFSVRRPGSPGLPTGEELGSELKRLLQETVRPEIWYDNGGTAGRMEVVGGHVLVIAAWTHHRQIDTLLRQLRDPPLPKPANSG
jgi:hypothetical protein